MINKTKPHVTVIIPVFNSIKTIEKCICSVLKQSLTNIEIVIVDDCSVDGTVRFVEKLTSNDCRVLLLCNSINRGAGVCRNIGIAKANGEYIYFLDSDDFIPGNEVLESLYTAAIKNNARIIGGSVHRGEGEKNINIANKGTQFVLKRYELSPFDGGFYAYMYKTLFLKENNIVFPSYSNFEDPVFLVRAMCVSKEYLCCKEVTYLYTKIKKRVLNRRELCDRVSAINDILSIAGKMRIINYLMGKNLLDIFNYSGECRYLLRRNACGIIRGILRIKPNDKMPVKLSKIKLIYCFVKGIIKNG